MERRDEVSKDLGDAELERAEEKYGGESELGEKNEPEVVTHESKP